MKKLLILLVLCLTLTGCKKNQGNQHINNNEIITESSSTDSYRTIVSSSGTASREVFNSVFISNQLDFTKIGKGLEHICLDTFPTNEHFLKESEHLTYVKGTEPTGDYFYMMSRPDKYESTAIQSWADDVVDGVEKAHLFNALYAVDFYKNGKNDMELSGMGITAVITPDYLNTQTGITYTFSTQTIETYAKNAISKIYKYYHDESNYEEFKTLPIVIGIYQQASTTDDYSGRYLYSCVCENGKVGEIKEVNQRTYVFSSDAANKVDSSTASEFNIFKSKLKEASVDSIGIVGIGDYMDGKITSMTIDVNAVFKVYDEYKAIGQYIASLLNNQAFSEDFEIKIRLNNNARIFGVIIKDKGQQASFYML